MDIAYVDYDADIKEIKIKILFNEIYNQAIEDAALIADDMSIKMFDDSAILANSIRKLKK